MFSVTLLNHFYWFSGATLGGIFGSLIHFNTEGLEFVMTAMFVVIFLEQWLKEKDHRSGILGLILSAVCLAAFGADNFIIPAMLAILAVLTVMRPKMEEGGEVDDTDTADPDHSDGRPRDGGHAFPPLPHFPGGAAPRRNISGIWEGCCPAPYSACWSYTA